MYDRLKRSKALFLILATFFISATWSCSGDIDDPPSDDSSAECETDEDCTGRYDLCWSGTCTECRDDSDCEGEMAYCDIEWGETNRFYCNQPLTPDSGIGDVLEGVR